MEYTYYNVPLVVAVMIVMVVAMVVVVKPRAGIQYVLTFEGAFSLGNIQRRWPGGEWTTICGPGASCIVTQRLSISGKVARWFQGIETG